MVGMSQYSVDHEKFKGWAIHNSTEKPFGLAVNNESMFPKEFLLFPDQTYYPYVGDIVSILSLEDCEKLYINLDVDGLHGLSCEEIVQMSEREVLEAMQKAEYEAYWNKQTWEKLQNHLDMLRAIEP